MCETVETGTAPASATLLVVGGALVLFGIWLNGNKKAVKEKFEDAYDKIPRDIGTFID